MATMTFHIPTDLKRTFDATFKGQNKTAVVTRLIRDAVVREQRRQRHRGALARIVAGRSDAPLVRLEQFEAVREETRALDHIAWQPEPKPSQAE